MSCGKRHHIKPRLKPRLKPRPPAETPAATSHENPRGFAAGSDPWAKGAKRPGAIGPQPCPPAPSPRASPRPSNSRRARARAAAAAPAAATDNSRGPNCVRFPFSIGFPLGLGRGLHPNCVTRTLSCGLPLGLQIPVALARGLPQPHQRLPPTVREGCIPTVPASVPRTNRAQRLPAYASRRSSENLLPAAVTMLQKQNPGPL
jgi:hypothetical protein